MSEPKLNTRYKCFLNGKIEIEPAQSGALMVKIPYQSIDEDPVAGVHTICIVAKDGTPQEIAINNLMTIFNLNEVMGLVELPESVEQTHQFDLSDWESKEKYPGFRWLNPPKNDSGIDEIKKKYGSILSRFSKAKIEVKPVEKVESKIPTKKANRFSNSDEVWKLLVEKQKGVSEDDLANKHLYPAIDKVIGKTGFDDLASVTPEQWGKVADELGV